MILTTVWRGRAVKEHDLIPLNVLIGRLGRFFFEGGGKLQTVVHGVVRLQEPSSRAAGRKPDRSPSSAFRYPVSIFLTGEILSTISSVVLSVQFNNLRLTRKAPHRLGT
jgi:hypothetical protein